jgi:hypothetical protein
MVRPTMAINQNSSSYNNLPIWSNIGKFIYFDFYNNKRATKKQA